MNNTIITFITFIISVFLASCAQNHTTTDIAQHREVNSITKSGSGYIGCYVQKVAAMHAEYLGLQEAGGALVGSIEQGGPADEAGIEVGDIILKFDDEKISAPEDLVKIIVASPIGETFGVDIWRSGKRLSINVKIGDRSAVSRATP